MDYTKQQKPMSYLERYIASSGIGGALKSAGQVLGAADLSGGDEPSVLERASEKSADTLAEDQELVTPSKTPPIQDDLHKAGQRLRDLT